MRPVLFRRPEGDEDRFGPDKPGFELGHGQFFDDHCSTSSAPAMTGDTFTKTQRTCNRHRSFFLLVAPTRCERMTFRFERTFFDVGTIVH
jgi:hypothetical protein